MRVFVAVTLCLFIGSGSTGFIDGGSRVGPTIIAHSVGGGAVGVRGVVGEGDASPDGHRHTSLAAHVPIDASAARPIVQVRQSEASRAGIIAAGPTQPQVHEIHSHSGKSVIRVEEYARPNQVIRVHEAPQAPPEVLKVKGPSEPQNHIRIVAKSSGPAHVERVVHRPREAQVIDIRKPARPPARIVHIVRDPAPAPKIEFVNEPERQSHIYIAQSPADADFVLTPGSASGSLPGNPALRGSDHDDLVAAQRFAGVHGSIASILQRYNGNPVISEPLPTTQASGPVFRSVAADSLPLMKSFGPGVSPISTLDSFGAAAPTSVPLGLNIFPIQHHAGFSYGGHDVFPVKTKIFRNYHHHSHHH